MVFFFFSTRIRRRIKISGGSRGCFVVLIFRTLWGVRFFLRRILRRFMDGIGRGSGEWSFREGKVGG